MLQPPHSRFSQKRKVDFKPYRGKMPPFKPITLTPVTDEWAPKGHLNGNLSLEENAANYSSSESPGNKVFFFETCTFNISMCF